MVLSATFYTLSAQTKHFTYEQVYEYSQPKVLADLPEIDGWLDGENYLQYIQDSKQNISRLVKINAGSGKAKTFIDYQELSSRLAGLDLREAEDHSNDYRSYILDKEDDLYYFSLKDRTLRRLTNTAAAEKNPVLSPDGHYVAFSRDHDLYIIDIPSGIEKRLTFDGNDTVYNGWAAWVYYEEVLGRSCQYRAFWWSPNSASIAFMRFDESMVPQFPIFDAAGIHGRLEMQRYPKAGDPVPQVRLGIVHINTGEISWVEFDQGTEHYLARPFWSPDGTFLIGQWFNRPQDLARLYHIDAASGQKKLIYEEKSGVWIEFYTDLYVLKNDQGFILRSDRDGWYHLYYCRDDKRIQLTSGEWNVSSLVQVDEQNQRVYFTGTFDHPTQTHLYKTDFSGRNLQRLTALPGDHEIDLSPGADYYIDTYSNINQPSKMDLCRNDGKLVRTIGDRKTDALNEYELGNIQIFSIPTEDGHDLPALWILPPRLVTGKRYPVIFQVYGGPEAADVSDRFRYLRDHFLAQQGIITMVVDNRGSGHLGKAGMMMMNRQLGKWEVEDLITAVKWLRRQPMVDSTKIGITGSSYGGYVTCMALTYGADYFNCGVAGLSVTDWRLYDAIYTERYMDTPAENPQGYQAAAVMTWAEKYKGKLLLIHGSMDDNVHYQNTLQLISKLQDLVKDFELMIYPGVRHGWRGPKRSHEDRMTYDFWMRNFLGRE